MRRGKAELFQSMRSEYSALKASWQGYDAYGESCEKIRPNDGRFRIVLECTAHC